MDCGSVFAVLFILGVLALLAFPHRACEGCGSKSIDALTDPATGKPFWHCRGCGKGHDHPPTGLDFYSGY